MIILSFRSYALWLLGYPEAALADIDQALKDAREMRSRSLPVMGAQWLILYRDPLRKLQDSECESR